MDDLERACRQRCPPVWIGARSLVEDAIARGSDPLETLFQCVEQELGLPRNRQIFCNRSGYPLVSLHQLRDVVKEASGIRVVGFDFLSQDEILYYACAECIANIDYELATLRDKLTSCAGNVTWPPPQAMPSARVNNAALPSPGGLLPWVTTWRSFGQKGAKLDSNTPTPRFAQTDTFSQSASFAAQLRYAAHRLNSKGSVGRPVISRTLPPHDFTKALRSAAHDMANGPSVCADASARTVATSSASRSVTHVPDFAQHLRDAAHRLTKLKSPTREQPTDTMFNYEAPTKLCPEKMQLRPYGGELLQQPLDVDSCGEPFLLAHPKERPPQNILHASGNQEAMQSRVEPTSKLPIDMCINYKVPAKPYLENSQLQPFGELLQPSLSGDPCGDSAGLTHPKECPSPNILQASENPMATYTNNSPSTCATLSTRHAEPTREQPIGIIFNSQLQPCGQLLQQPLDVDSCGDSIVLTHPKELQPRGELLQQPLEVDSCGDSFVFALPKERPSPNVLRASGNPMAMHIDNLSSKCATTSTSHIELDSTELDNTMVAAIASNQEPCSETLSDLLSSHNMDQIIDSGLLPESATSFHGPPKSIVAFADLSKKQSFAGASQGALRAVEKYCPDQPKSLPVTLDLTKNLTPSASSDNFHLDGDSQLAPRVRARPESDDVEVAIVPHDAAVSVAPDRPRIATLRRLATLCCYDSDKDNLQDSFLVDAGRVPCDMSDDHRDGGKSCSNSGISCSNSDSEIWEGNGAIRRSEIDLHLQRIQWLRKPSEFTCAPADFEVSPMEFAVDDRNISLEFEISPETLLTRSELDDRSTNQSAQGGGSFRFTDCESLATSLNDFLSPEFENSTMTPGSLVGENELNDIVSQFKKLVDRPSPFLPKASGEGLMKFDDFLKASTWDGVLTTFMDDECPLAENVGEVSQVEASVKEAPSCKGNASANSKCFTPEGKEITHLTDRHDSRNSITVFAQDVPHELAILANQQLLLQDNALAPCEDLPAVPKKLNSRQSAFLGSSTWPGRRTVNFADEHECEQIDIASEYGSDSAASDMDRCHSLGSTDSMSMEQMHSQLSEASSIDIDPFCEHALGSDKTSRRGTSYSDNLVSSLRSMSPNPVGRNLSLSPIGNSKEDALDTTQPCTSDESRSDVGRAYMHTNEQRSTAPIMESKALLEESTDPATCQAWNTDMQHHSRVDTGSSSVEVECGGDFPRSLHERLHSAWSKVLNKAILVGNPCDVASLGNETHEIYARDDGANKAIPAGSTYECPHPMKGRYKVSTEIEDAEEMKAIFVGSTCHIAEPGNETREMSTHQKDDEANKPIPVGSTSDIARSVKEKLEMPTVVQDHEGDIVMGRQIVTNIEKKLEEAKVNSHCADLDACLADVQVRLLSDDFRSGDRRNSTCSQKIASESVEVQTEPTADGELLARGTQSPQKTIYEACRLMLQNFGALEDLFNEMGFVKGSHLSRADFQLAMQRLGYPVDFYKLYEVRPLPLLTRFLRHVLTPCFQAWQSIVKPSHRSKISPITRVQAQQPQPQKQSQPQMQDGTRHLDDLRARAADKFIAAMQSGTLKSIVAKLALNDYLPALPPERLVWAIIGR